MRAAVGTGAMRSKYAGGEWTGRVRTDMRGVRAQSGGRAKDRMQEPEADKRRVGRGGTQGREWVGLNLCLSPGLEMFVYHRNFTRRITR
jgi:hypothetical protein